MASRTPVLEGIALAPTAAQSGVGVRKRGVSRGIKGSNRSYQRLRRYCSAAGSDTPSPPLAVAALWPGSREVVESRPGTLRASTWRRGSTRCHGYIRPVRAVVSELRKTRAYRVLKIVSSLAGALFGIIGVAGLFDDIETWGEWIGAVDSGLVYGLLYSVLLTLCLALLATEMWPLRAKSSTEAARARSTPSPRQGVDVRTNSNPQPPAGPRLPRDPPAAPHGARKLSDRLQAELDSAVRLRNNISSMAGVGGFGLVRPETTEQDVDMWVRRTQRLLRDEDPVLLAEFNYRPGKALLDPLLPTQSLAPRYKKGLDQRIANLRGIISDLRDAGK